MTRFVMIVGFREDEAPAELRMRVARGARLGRSLAFPSHKDVVHPARIQISGQLEFYPTAKPCLSF